MGKPLSPLTRTFSVTASTTPLKAFGSNPSRTGAFLQNGGSVTVYVTSAQNCLYLEGIPVEAGAWFEDDSSTAELWVLTASSTAACSCKEDTS